MMRIVKIVAITIFIVVFVIVAFFITAKIFSKVVGIITGQQTENTIKDIVHNFTGRSRELEKKSCVLAPHKREFTAQAYYDGPLIDSHVHFPTASRIVSSVAGQNGLELPVLEGKLSTDSLVCLFENEGIIKTFAFHITSKFAKDSAVSTARKIEKEYPGKIVHFLMPPPIKSLNVAPSEIEEILEDNEGLFQGFGEVALYMNGYERTKIDDPDFKKIYKLADEHNLIVMLHPEDNVQDGVEEILQEFPNVTFLFHGGQPQEWIVDLMDTYKNFYFSVDTQINHLYGWQKEHQFKKPTKEEFLAYTRENFASNLEEVLKRWEPKIKKYPDRFTWGTDRWFAWHFDPQLGEILEELSRSFIGRLDSTVQEKYAYKNAETMLRER